MLCMANIYRGKKNPYIIYLLSDYWLNTIILFYCIRQQYTIVNNMKCTILIDRKTKPYDYGV